MFTKSRVTDSPAACFCSPLEHGKRSAKEPFAICRALRSKMQQNEKCFMRKDEFFVCYALATPANGSQGCLIVILLRVPFVTKTQHAVGLLLMFEFSRIVIWFGFVSTATCDPIPCIYAGKFEDFPSDVKERNVRVALPLLSANV